MKKLKKKDENFPRRGLTSFLHYIQEKREAYKKEHPEMTHKEVISKLGEVWNSLGDKEKEPYHAKAQIDKDRYRNAKEIYVKNKAAAAAQKKKKDDEPLLEKKLKLVNFYIFIGI